MANNGSVDVPVLVIHSERVLFAPLGSLSHGLLRQLRDDPHPILGGCTPPFAQLLSLGPPLPSLLQQLLRERKWKKIFFTQSKFLGLRKCNYFYH